LVSSGSRLPRHEEAAIFIAEVHPASSIRIVVCCLVESKVDASRG
jgi:hypothetical protein